MAHRGTKTRTVQESGWLTRTVSVESNVPAGAARRFGLGELTAKPVELHGGVNRVWRVTTARGMFAIHELLGIPAGIDIVERCQRIFELETAATNADVVIALPVPEPVSGRACAFVDGAEGGVTVHEWVDGRPVDTCGAAPVYYRALGSSLARLHNLDLLPVRFAGDPLERRPSVGEWEELATRAAAQSLPWAGDLWRSAEDLVAAAAQLDVWDSASDVFSHRDLTTGNVLSVEGLPVLIDWESAGLVGRAAEIGRTALDHVSQDERMEPALLRAYLAGYAESAPLPEVGPDWCALWIRGLIVFAEQCARSCIEGSSPRSLLEFQLRIVESTPELLKRRLAKVGPICDAFQQAVAPIRSW